MPSKIDKQLCVIDSGVFDSWAHRLARDYDRPVWYYRPDPPREVHSDDDSIGDGYEDIIRITDFWDHIDEIDTFCFLDVNLSHWANHLLDLGKPVWSAFNAEELETDRVTAKKVMKKVGIPVGPYEVITGMDALREYLKANEDQVVKVSRVRALTETFPAREPLIIDLKLDKLQADLGAKKRSQVFIVEQAIDDAITEDGYDGYNIEGQFPRVATFGTEIKNNAYAMKVIPYAMLPPEVRQTNERLAPELKKYGYRQFFHTEIKKTKKSYFPIDYTTRAASPAGECLQELYRNAGEIIEAGAHGEFVEPNYEARFAVQASIVTHRADLKWVPIVIPDKIRRWVKIFGSYYDHDEKCEYVVLDDDEYEVGTVVGIGSSIAEAKKRVAEYADQIKNSEITIKLESLDDAEKELAKT
jgi:hypothetical protein